MKRTLKCCNWQIKLPSRLKAMSPFNWIAGNSVAGLLPGCFRI